MYDNDENVNNSTGTAGQENEMLSQDDQADNSVGDGEDSNEERLLLCLMGKPNAVNRRPMASSDTVSMSARL